MSCSEILFYDKAHALQSATYRIWLLEWIRMFHLPTAGFGVKNWQKLVSTTGWSCYEVKVT